MVKSRSSALALRALLVRTGSSLAQVLPRAGTHVFLLAICVLWILPLLGLGLTSFRLPDLAASHGWWRVYEDPGLSVQAYSDMLARRDMFGAAANSFLLALPASVMVVSIAAPAAWAFANLRFWGREVLFVLVALMLLTPRQLSFEPLLVFFSSIGMNGTFASLWTYMVAFQLPLSILILRGAFRSIPQPLVEAARIDGATDFAVFTRVVAPLSLPALGAVFVLTFVDNWNELLAPLIFLPGDTPTVTVALTRFVNAQDLSSTVVAAAAVFAIIPPVVLFVILQRFFVSGVASGAVKE